MFDWIRRRWRKGEAPVEAAKIDIIPMGYDLICVGNTLIPLPDGKYKSAVTFTRRDAMIVDADGDPVEGQDLPEGTIFLMFRDAESAFDLIGAIHDSLLLVAEIDEPIADND